VSLQAPHTAFQGRSAEIVIRVQDEQGEALDGVPVVFEVDPTWDGDAAVFPQSTMTNRGIARVQFQADSIGVVNVTARVGQVTRTVPIVITMLHNTGQGW
jgi:hypothetical protein